MKPDVNDSLVARLARWKGDRGALASLRGGLRSQAALRRRAWPLLAQLTSLESPLLVIYETAAGLWAADPDSHRAGAGNFGVTCRRLRGDHESFDLRFRRLLACADREELCERLIPIAVAAQTKAVPLDFDALFQDLKFFADAGRDRVRLRWAQAYWGAAAEDPGNQPESRNASVP